MRLSIIPRSVALSLPGAWLIALCATWPAGDGLFASEPHLSKSPHAWTLDDALGHLALNPRDPYIQYIALQLADAADRRKSVADEIERWTRPNNWRTGRRDQVDLFSVFSGALAVQESLQLDTLRGERQTRRGQPQFANVKELEGPTIKSHPWKEMLAGRAPEVSELSRCVPADQYLIQSRSLVKLVDLADTGDLWATHLFKQAAQDATTARVGDRLREQLAIRVSPLTKPFYDTVVEQIAVTGSDLYLREGSDVTLLFKLRQPSVFKRRMDQFLDEAANSAQAERTTGRAGGVEYTHVATPDRRVHVFSAWPREDLHVRSNSLFGLARVLAAIRGETETGDPVQRLGETDEFKYIRTLMPEGASEEDVFVYLSDPFIRHLVGPKLKLTERRRMLGYNHLRMINHAAMMYRTQYGRRAETLEDLVAGGCARDVYDDGPLASPFGGEYALGEDGLTGWCSKLGTPRQLVPCCELPLEKVTQEEAEAYNAFLNEYNSYWRTFFDPIAVRIRVAPEQYRAETIVLPLIDNSVYTGLSQALGGEPRPLDALPVPKGNIFTLAMQFDQETFAKQLPEMLDDFGRELDDVVPEADLRQIDVKALVERGLGNQLALHMYDATQLFEFNLTSFLGQAFGTFGGRSLLGNDTVWISMLVASLNSPVYVSIPVKDAEVVDQFLESMDPLLAAMARRPARGWFFEVNSDFYALPAGESSSPVRTFALSFGPLKWRFFWARIGDGLYIATKKFVLDDIVAAQQQGERSDAGPAAHAMVRLRPEHWNKVLPDFQLGWAENSRIACLNNLGMLTGVARAHAAENAHAAKPSDRRDATGRILAEAGTLYGIDFLSPGGGEYLLADDGRTMEHTLYGSQRQPRQPERPGARSETTETLGQIGGVTVSLTFLEDGLHAVLEIDRKP